MLLAIVLVMAVAPEDLVGFWHSEPDMTQGMGECFFFWGGGEYAYCESVEVGSVWLGTWQIQGNTIVLDRNDGITLDGIPMNVYYSSSSVDVIPYSGKSDMMSFAGNSFYLLNTDPFEAIISLVPTWGMNQSERDAFSTYD